jgi:hypothetical protein
LVFSAGLFTALSQGPPAAAGVSSAHSGVVFDVQSDRLVLQTATNTFVEFRVTAASAVFKDGRPATARDLAAGDLAQITARAADEEELHASVVRARTRW